MSKTMMENWNEYMGPDSQPLTSYDGLEELPMTRVQKIVHQIAVDKGWFDTELNIPGSLAMIHSEISEALEEYRNGMMEVYYAGGYEKPEGFGVELADAVIRIMDIAEHLDINLYDLIMLKSEYNRTRPYRHGGKKI